MHVKHPLIRESSVEEREYQTSLARICGRESTLVVIPTGMGKTIIALRVVADALHKGAAKALVLAPTRPLVEQHRDVLQDRMPTVRVASMTGETAPEKRVTVWEGGTVIVSTPQVIANDLDKGRYDLNDVGILVYDEAHRGVGSYSYVRVAEHYHPLRRLSMGITASPGSDSKRIMEVCENLRLFRIEVRTEDDPDVAPYVHRIEMKTLELDLPEDLMGIIAVLRKLLDKYIDELVQLRFLDDRSVATAKRLLALGKTLQARAAHEKGSYTVFRGLTVQAMAMKIIHAIGLAETQGTTSLSRFLDRLEEEKGQEKSSRATRELLANHEYDLLREMLAATKTEHPKVSRVMTLVSRQLDSKPDSRVLVFTHYRDTCEMVADRLARIPSAKVGRLIGQAGHDGLKQKGQADVLRQFREGLVNVLVATSVGEEGLDVANTDMVLFYEPVPSEIRSIQRRGRTGRFSDGEVHILIAKGTRDEAFQNSSLNKERKMKRRLEDLDRELRSRRQIEERVRSQSSLTSFR